MTFFCPPLPLPLPMKWSSFRFRFRFHKQWDHMGFSLVFARSNVLIWDTITNLRKVAIPYLARFCRIFFAKKLLTKCGDLTDARAVCRNSYADNIIQTCRRRHSSLHYSRQLSASPSCRRFGWAFSELYSTFIRFPLGWPTSWLWHQTLITFPTSLHRYITCTTNSRNWRFGHYC